jgi:regulator of sigma E protease
MLNALHGFVSWTPLGLPAYIFVITIVVFFHELGHYAVARAFGVKVDVFSIGFGREITGWTAKSGTRWKISLIPFGGYVKFAGDANAASVPDREAAEQMPVAMRGDVLFFRPLYQRALVAAAGPVANFILAIVLFTGLLLHDGRTIVAPVIGTVTKGSAAAMAGIRPGDRILRIGDTRIDGFQQMSEIIGLSGGKQLSIGLERGGHDLTVRLAPRNTRARDMLGEMEDRLMIGVGSQARPTLTTIHYSLPGAFAAACGMTWDILSGTLEGVVQMLRGQVSVSQLHGPVGIADMTQKIAVLGFMALLNLSAVLSVSIGLVNLFPIPLLDGGHLLYYGCEAVLGRPLGERAQDVGFRLGLALVLGFAILVTWNDLIRLNLF